MKQTDIPTLVNTYDWEKRWMERNNLLTCSLVAELYYFENQKQWGVSFDHVFFLYREGIVTCYQLISENTTYGSTLAQQVIKQPAITDVWCNDLLAKTAMLREYVSNNSNRILNKAEYKKFIELFYAYPPLLIGVIRVVNYLPESVLEQVLPTLQKARFETETAYGQVDTFLTSLLTALAKKENRNPEFLQLMYASEVEAYLENGYLPTDDELAPRQPVSGLYCEKGALMSLNKRDAELFEKFVAEKSVPASGIMRGSTAVKGIVEGTARIIYDPKKINIFNAGDILITSMTNPEFVPLMKKAGAIVTDGGGILCHAAIVARELNKPCVINTQVATTTFKDGDMVEVDAIHGIIKKI